jgi:hypothetical protein
MLNKVAEAIAARDYERASRGQMEILRERAEECGQWMVSSSLLGLYLCDVCGLLTVYAGWAQEVD